MQPTLLVLVRDPCGTGTATYQDQGAARGPRWNRGEYWRKEDGHDETQARHDSRQTRAPALSNASTALDKGRDGRRAKERRDGYKSGIGAIRNGGAGKVAVLVNDTAEAHHRVQSGRGVNDVHVQKGEEGECKVGAARLNVPFELVCHTAQRMPRDDLLEELETRVALDGVGKVCDGSVAAGSGQLKKSVQKNEQRNLRPRNDRDQSDTNDECILDPVRHQESSQDTTAENSKPKLQR